jgi:hypothetical protein
MQAGGLPNGSVGIDTSIQFEFDIVWLRFTLKAINHAGCVNLMKTFDIQGPTQLLDPIKRVNS